jgi:photosystem II PsbY protein
MFAAMATSESAMAAQQMMALAEGDNRAVALLIPLVPAIGWVLFNILKPALNQVDKMRSAKGLVAGAGLGALAALAAAPQADAVQEIAQVADNDARGLIIIGLLLPAVGWVLFNILRPALNQIEKMQEGNSGLKKARGIIGVTGISAAAASLLAAPQANAQVQELAQVSADTRPLILLFILAPAIGWVLFNILKPALNQIEKMQNGNFGKGGRRK